VLKAALLAVVIAAPLAVGAGGTGHAEVTSERVTTSTGPLWPASICTRSHSQRFATTTEGDQGEIVIEPAATGAHPVISEARAFRHFTTLYGRPISPAQTRHLQVRFGLVSDLSSGPQSGNVVGYVPELRRTPAWIVTDCVDARAPAEHPEPPRGYRSRGLGQLSFIVADTTAASSPGYEFVPHHQRDNVGASGPYESPRPSPRLTPYYSTPWHPTSYRRNGNVLIRYAPRRCYTLDHVNVYSNHGIYEISVILSSGVDGRCLRPSSTAPYAEVRRQSNGGAIRAYRHERTGRARFEPESA
jgi:hypothetical protein